jgi:ribonuclease HII
VSPRFDAGSGPPPRPRPGPFDPARAADWPAAIGCDEVGRGALCGPVVTAAVWFEPSRLPPDLLAALDDSKRLTPARREAAAARLAGAARFAVAAACRAEVDRAGVRAATLAAMARAVARVGIDAPVLVDGRDVPPGLTGRARAVVGGDGAVPQIAAASIIAKVLRDRAMARLAARWPAYGWDRNAGYGVAGHLEALRASGPTPHHRRSFAPVAAAGGSGG